MFDRISRARTVQTEAKRNTRLCSLHKYPGVTANCRLNQIHSSQLLVKLYCYSDTQTTLIKLIHSACWLSRDGKRTVQSPLFLTQTLFQSTFFHDIRAIKPYYILQTNLESSCFFHKVQNVLGFAYRLNSSLKCRIRQLIRNFWMTLRVDSLLFTHCMSFCCRCGLCRYSGWDFYCERLNEKAFKVLDCVT